MQIQTSRFGLIEFDEDRVFTFPDGLPGFEDFQRFVFVPHPSPEGDSLFQWMQSVDLAELAFLTIEPHHCFPGYKPKISVSDHEAIALTDAESEPHVVIILTVPEGNPAGITANLMAPLVINQNVRLGRQVVVSDDHYGIRHRLLPEEAVSAPNQAMSTARTLVA